MFNVECSMFIRVVRAIRCKKVISQFIPGTPYNCKLKCWGISVLEGHAPSWPFWAHQGLAAGSWGTSQKTRNNWEIRQFFAALVKVAQF